MPGESLPLSVDEITPAWLTGALSSRVPDAAVERIEVDAVIRGTATKVLIAVTYADAAAGPPARLCVKGGFTPETRQALGSVYQAEALFYRDIAPTLSAGLPTCWFAGVDDTAGQGVVLLEDLRDLDARFLGPGESLTPEQADRGLAVLADLHATDTAGAALPGSPQNMRALASSVVLTPELWAAGMAVDHPDVVREALADRDRYLRGLEALWAIEDAYPTCLTHGDANATNIYVADGRDVAFVDWQFVARADWAHDVGFFLISSLSPPDRRAHERDLVDRYVARRAELGVPLAPGEDAWERYRQHAVYGLIYAVTPDEMQPAAVRGPLAERFADAALQHRVYDLLGV